MILFNHLICERNQPRWNGESERFGGLKIDHEFVFGRLKNWQIGWLRAFEDLPDVGARVSVGIFDVGSIADQTSIEDLRVKPRDPEASIRVGLRDVRCPRCNGYGKPRIIALARHPSI